jgi:NADH:ubiquinone oxidoreductase subunit 6 (subunit J)
MGLTVVIARNPVHGALALMFVRLLTAHLDARHV